MALMTINEAARLVRKDKSILQRDIERGLLGKTDLHDGEVRVDSSEVLRKYEPGQVPAEEEQTVTGERLRLALLEERVRSLERALSLEAELRRSKDQIASELRARLADKENLIKVLESKVLFLEYDRQIHDVPTLDTPDEPHARQPDHRDEASRAAQRAGFWSRIFHHDRH